MSNFLKNVISVKADDKSLVSKGSGVFGLNTGNIVKFEYTDKAGQNETEADAVDIHIMVSDRSYNTRLYLSPTVKNNKNEEVNPGDETYEEEFERTYTQVIAVIKHVLGSLGIKTEQIEKSTDLLAEQETPIKTVVEFVKILIGLVPTNYKSIPVDIFLEYQWNIGKDQDRTFLTVPRNMKGGSFICPKMTPKGEWTEVRDEEGLHYVDNEGNKHLFNRNSNYMDSNKAKQQFKGKEESSSTVTSPLAAATGTAPTGMWK